MAEYAPPRRIVRSVFTKLLLVALITGVGMTLLVIGYFIAYRHASGSTMGTQWAGIIRYLVHDLGTPPELSRAQIMARDLGVQIYYQGPKARWSTTPAPLPANLDKLRIWHRGPDYQIGSLRGHPLLIVTRGSERIIFDTRKTLVDHTWGQRLTLMFLLLMLALLAMAYGLIRWLLRPLRPLHEGVRRVSQGELDHQIRSSGKDEFHDLAAAFNTMTRRMGNLLRAKERLLLDVSHELRSPITRMKVALEMLPEGDQKTRLQEDLQEMERMLTEILETYRSLSDSVNLKPTQVELSDLIKKTAALFADHPPGIASRAMEPVRVTGDPRKLKTLLTNLLDNALKYSRPADPSVEIGLQSEGNWAIIQIEDHGIGIPESAIPHLFEPFYRADASRTPSSGGFGLGLSLCKAIVQAHGGTIAVESTEGQGTTVTLRLPRSGG